MITGTHVGNVDGQLGARPAGPGRLYFCVNRGSEVYAPTTRGLELLVRREATPEEDAALDGAAAMTRARARPPRGGRGARVATAEPAQDRPDPEAEWADPPKARLEPLLAAVQERLRAVGLAGLSAAVEIALAAARVAGLPDPRVTSDAKHVEIGLTDKADSARWAFAELARRGIGPASC